MLLENAPNVKKGSLITVNGISRYEGRFRDSWTGIQAAPEGTCMEENISHDGLAPLV